MNKKHVFLALIGFVVLSSVVAFYSIWKGKIQESILPVQELVDVSREEHKETEELADINNVTQGNEDGEDINLEEVEKVAEKPVENKTENVPVYNNQKRIDCVFTADEGEKSDEAILAWNCREYVGWTCDLHDKYDQIFQKNVKLPVGKTIAKAAKASYYNSRNSDGNWGSLQSSPGQNTYRLICRAIDGKLKNFTDYYTNYHH